MSHRIIGASVFAAFVFTGCSHYSQQDGERLHNEVYALLTQVNAMQQAITEQQSKVDSMSREVSDLGSSSRRNSADFGVSIDEMREEFARMRGVADSFQERVSTLEAGFSKVQEELDLRFSNLAEQTKINQAKSEAEKQAAIEETRRREQLLSDPKRLFAETEKDIRGGRPTDARKLLRDFVIRAQQDSRLKNSLAQAQYLIGESYYAEGRYQNAAAEYNTVRKNWSKSSLVPDALYKLGLCFENLKLPADAKLFYRTVTQKYPKSSVAKDAAKRLKQLN
ncbi:MAG: tetratricopeptide repeat protein [Deltaproteobacteria bacterium]|nr:tetratricopeptide repeat protein [Deltaproteobacteria bacterium]